MIYLILTVATGFGLFRLFKGPTILDRLIAFDALSICIVAMMILFLVDNEMPYFVDIILIFCLLGFTSTIAFMDYLLKRERREIKGEEHE